MWYQVYCSTRQQLLSLALYQPISEYYLRFLDGNRSHDHCFYYLVYSTAYLGPQHVLITYIFSTNLFDKACIENMIPCNDGGKLENAHKGHTVRLTIIHTIYWKINEDFCSSLKMGCLIKISFTWWKLEDLKTNFPQIVMLDQILHYKWTLFKNFNIK